MYFVKISNRINQIHDVFYRVGMWQIKKDSSTFFVTSRKILFVILIFCYGISLMLGGLFSDDWNESIFLTSVGVAALAVTVKLIYIAFKEEEIRSFIQRTGTHFVSDYDQFLKINEKLKNLKNLTSCVIFLTCGVFFGLFLPVLSSERKLPVNIWVPLDWKNNAIVYWIAYTYVSVSSVIGVVAVLLNIIIWYLMMNCAIKYQVVGLQFKNTFSVKPTIREYNSSTEKGENSFLQELIGLIKDHQNIQEIVDQFKSCFGSLFFVQIITSGICICGSVYSLAFDTFDGNVTESVVYISLWIYNIFDIFMVLYLGNEIKLSRDRLSYCLFESNWVEQKKSCKKCLIILSEVLKQPQELVIGKVYPLDMKTFTSIVKLSYSMFNILQNLN